MNAALASVHSWIKIAQKAGVPMLLYDRPRHKPKPRTIATIKETAPVKRQPKAAIIRLRAIAATERNRRIAKRLRVVAELMEGGNALKVATRERMAVDTARQWLGSYRAGGIDALRYDAGRRPRLSLEQLAKLRTLIVAFPTISGKHLRAFAFDHFKIRYSDWGMRHLVRRMGFERVGKHHILRS